MASFGTTSGPWALTTGAGVAVALIAFGFAGDPYLNLRDSWVEIEALNQSSIDLTSSCREALDAVAPRLKQTVLNDLYNGAIFMMQYPLPVAGTVDIRFVYSCPLPQPNDTVETALIKVVSQPILVAPGGNVFVGLDAGVGMAKEKVDPATLADTLSAPEVHAFNVSLETMGINLAGFKTTQLGAVVLAQSSGSGYSPLGSCDGEQYLFDGVNAATAARLRVFAEVVGDDGAHHLVCNDAPSPTLANWEYDAPDRGVLPDLFGKLVSDNPHYSRSTTALQELNVHNFHFPVLSADLPTIRGKTLEQARQDIESKMAEADLGWEIFGQHLPPRLFLILALGTIALTSFIFAWAVNVAGSAALPDRLKYVPWTFRVAVVWISQAVLPSVGLLLAAERLHYSFPGEYDKLRLVALVWLFLSSCGVCFFASKLLRSNVDAT